MPATLLYIKVQCYSYSPIHTIQVHTLTFPHDGEAQGHYNSVTTELQHQTIQTQQSFRQHHL